MCDEFYLIGLDGASWEILGSMQKDLPYIQSLIESGVSGTLESTLPSKTPLAVPALYTGSDPSITGSFEFTKSNGQPLLLEEIRGPRLWNEFARHDESSVVMNVRTTHPPESIEGVMISGPPSPSEGTKIAIPPNSAEEHGFQAESHIDEQNFHDKPYARSEELVSTFIDAFQKRSASFESIIEATEPSLAMYWVGRTDSIQHWLWGDWIKIQKFYRAVDERLSEIIPENANVILVSDHGFAEMAKYRFHINEWLRQNDFLDVWCGQIGNYVLGATQQKLRGNVSSELLKRLIEKINTNKSSGAAKRIDRSRTHIPGIKSSSNAQMSTPWGIDVLNTGRQYEKTRNKIIAALTDLTHNNSTVVKNALKKEEVYSEGPYFNEVPDIVFQLNSNYFAEASLSTSIFSNFNQNRPGENQFNGWHDHSPEGIFIASGPRFTSKKITSLHITDIAPTILHSMGFPVPDVMTGNVHRDILREDSEARETQPEYIPVDPQSGISSNISKEDMDAVYDHLEELGYR